MDVTIPVDSSAKFVFGDDEQFAHGGKFFDYPSCAHILKADDTGVRSFEEIMTIQPIDWMYKTFSVNPLNQP